MAWRAGRVDGFNATWPNELSPIPGSVSNQARCAASNVLFGLEPYGCRGRCGSLIGAFSNSWRGLWVPPWLESRGPQRFPYKDAFEPQNHQALVPPLYHSISRLRVNGHGNKCSQDIFRFHFVQGLRIREVVLWLATGMASNEQNVPRNDVITSHRVHRKPTDPSAPLSLPQNRSHAGYYLMVHTEERGKLDLVSSTAQIAFYSFITVQFR